MSGIMRGVIVQFRVTDSEKWLLDQAAAMAGLRTSEWIRQLALATATPLVGHRQDLSSSGITISLTNTGQVKYVDTSGS